METKSELRFTSIIHAHDTETNLVFRSLTTWYVFTYVYNVMNEKYLFGN